MDFSEAKSKCLETMQETSAFSKIELVYGNLGKLAKFWRYTNCGCALHIPYCSIGDGKTHYIRKRLADSMVNHTLTIAVNEAFSVENVIKKLLSIPPGMVNCAIFFNFTLLPPGVCFSKASACSTRIATRNHDEHVHCWFFNSCRNWWMTVKGNITTVYWKKLDGSSLTFSFCAT